MYNVESYIKYLAEEEKSTATQRQYLRDVIQFCRFAQGLQLCKELIIRYKEYLQLKYKAASVNAKLVAVNGFLAFIGVPEYRVRLMKMQQKAFISEEKELTRNEYARLIVAARRKKNRRLVLLLETICGTGIRVSELRYITVEAARKGEAVISMKGKTRVILIPQKLETALLKYAEKCGIESGPVFVTKKGNPIDRSNIWKMMKSLCELADVARSKVYPHSLRHLFARVFYNIYKDIARLSDILGHSSINTTRIYTVSSGHEHRDQINLLDLVI